VNLAAKGETTGDAEGLGWTAVTGRITGCAGWMWTGATLGLAFGRGKF
jgi:hypothetical protein